MGRAKVDQFAMNKLHTLRTRLARLRRRRRLLRLATGYSALGLALLTILALALGIDWFLEMSRAQRVVALLVALAALVWAVRRYTLPWLGRREDEVEVALLVERQERIDTDLVAALEFESPAAAAWGSEQLQQAVIQQGARIGERLDIGRGLSLRQLMRRVTALALVAALWAGIACWSPEIMLTFFHRLLLSAQRYPSRTLIESITINDQSIDPHDPGRAPLKLPYGSPVRFAIVCSGKLPQSGQAELTVVPNGPQAIVALPGDRRSLGVYRGEFARLLESVEFRLLAGDAATERGQLVVVAPPTADLEMEVLAPSYTGLGGPRKVAPGLRQVPVIEGSRVNVRIRCDKRLRQATLAIEGRKFALRREESAGGKADSWTLDVAGTPLAAVVEEIQYTIQVEDLDGLHLQQPLQGVIRTEPDQPPQISGSIVTPKVLPTARPTLRYVASDDYGLARVAVIRQVIHADGQTSEDQVEIYKPVSEHSLERKLEDRYALDLTSLKLVKGDQVKVVLQAVDFRGPRPGQATLSDPMVFQVTDQQGILTMMMESDRQSAEQLKKMIHDQLDVGGSP
jgi:hypothetical protein